MSSGWHLAISELQSVWSLKVFTSNKWTETCRYKKKCSLTWLKVISERANLNKSFPNSMVSPKSVISPNLPFHPTKALGWAQQPSYIPCHPSQSLHQKSLSKYWRWNLQNHHFQSQYLLFLPLHHLTTPKLLRGSTTLTSEVWVTILQQTTIAGWTSPWSIC